MLPSNLEYLTLILIYGLIIFTLLQDQARHVLAGKPFWLSCIAFCLLWTTLEMYALRNNWWEFSVDKICGIYIATLPIEEYVLFFLIHLSTTSLWTAFQHNDLA
jgi:lycopene cyclase domain-containing protein